MQQLSKNFANASIDSANDKGSSGTLIVGGDGLIGAAFATCLRSSGRRVFATTRRSNQVGPLCPLLDLFMPEAFIVPKGVDRACIVASISNYGLCDSDPNAWFINVQAIPRLTERLLENGLHVSFISTNTVFGGGRMHPGEDDLHAPGISYAKQKSAGEAALAASADRLAARGRLSVIRLTKVLDLSTPPIPNWLAAWSRGEVVQPFSDLVFAPMSIDYVSEALTALDDQRVSGNLHLSGKEDVTYVDFARLLALRLGIPLSFVGSTTARQSGISIAFMPIYSALSMARTTALTNIRPQSLNDVVDDLVNAIRSRNGNPPG